MVKKIVQSNSQQQGKVSDLFEARDSKSAEVLMAMWNHG